MPLADIRPALRGYLLADSSISTAVGSARIFPTVLKQGVVEPSIVYNVISETTDHHTEGASGLVMVRMQIDAYASTATEADMLSRLIKERIDGFRGSMEYGPSSPGQSVTVKGTFAETARTDYQDASKLYRSSRDYLIWYAER